MELIELCRKTYREFIEREPMHVDIRRMLRTHERVPKFIDNLAYEFSKAKNVVKREDVIKGVEDMTRFFIANAVRFANERHMSRLAKLMMKQKADEKKKLDALADAINQGGQNAIEKTKDGETHKQTVDVISAGIL